MKIVIVGGVAVGAGTAARVRRLQEDAEIVVIERGEYVSFANCGLPYYIGGEIKDRQRLLLNTPKSLYDRFRIDVRVNQELVSIDREQKVVHVKNLANGTQYDEAYDKLVLAQGAAPIRPPLPGIDFENIFQVRVIPDVDAIQEQLATGRVKRAVVIGAGFIGLEMVEAFVNRNIPVTLVERGAQILPPMDPEMTVWATRALRDRGVELILSDGIASFVGVGKADAVVLESGKRVEGDLFVLGLGVRPDVRIASTAGLELGQTGALMVNTHLQTNDPNIYAAGDLAETTHAVTRGLSWIPLAGPANKQARVIATHLSGRPAEFSGVLGTSIVRFDRSVIALTGLSEKAAQRAGVPYLKSYSVSTDHASYYPGAKDILIKLLFTPDDGRLLGAQVIGEVGVDKRIDVLATAIQSGLTAPELAELDLAYSPPFSSAKDPVIMAGMAAENILLGLSQTVQNEQFDMFDPDVQLLDVRDAAETARGTMPGAMLIPLPELRDRLGELDKTRPVVVYCRGGQRSYIATRILLGNGFPTVLNWAGGYMLWDINQEFNEIVAQPV